MIKKIEKSKHIQVYIPTQVDSSGSDPNKEDAGIQRIIGEGGEIQTDSSNWTSGVFVFRRGRVWLGVSCVCPQDRWLLQQPVQQRDRCWWRI